MKIYISIISLFLSINANAALVARDLDGNRTTVEAYYDDATKLTWDQAHAWVNIDLNFKQYGGTDRWRLPYTPDSDYDCTNWTTADTCYQGEMATLFYGSMGNTVYGPSVSGPFENLQATNYWSGNSYYSLFNGSSMTDYILAFNMGYGNYRTTDETVGLYAMAVYDGDLGSAVVPLPASLWLLLSGLIMLPGMMKVSKSIE